MKTKNINVSGNPNSCLVTIGKQKFRSLVDTGAEVSLMHHRVYNGLKDKPKLKPKKVYLQTAGSTPLTVLGCVDVTFRIGGTEVSQEFHVVSNLNRNLILGLDFMKSHKARIYFDLKSMRIDDKVYVNLEEDIHIASTVRINHKNLSQLNFV